MKKLIVLTTLAMTLAACGSQGGGPAANAPSQSPPASLNVAGTWDGSLGNDANSSFNAKLRVAFVQDQKTLTGELFGYDEKSKQYARVGPINGSLNGNTGQWSLTTADGSGKMEITGTFSGDTFDGRHTTAYTGSGTAKGKVNLKKMSASSNNATIGAQSFGDSFHGLFK